MNISNCGFALIHEFMCTIWVIWKILENRNLIRIETVGQSAFKILFNSLDIIMIEAEGPYITLKVIPAS